MMDETTALEGDIMEDIMDIMDIYNSMEYKSREDMDIIMEYKSRIMEDIMEYESRIMEDIMEYKSRMEEYKSRIYKSRIMEYKRRMEYKIRIIMEEYKSHIMDLVVRDPLERERLERKRLRSEEIRGRTWENIRKRIGVVDNRTLQRLSVSIDSDLIWKLKIHLRIKTADGVNDGAMNMLKTWKKENNRQATFERLSEIMKEFGRNDLAEYVENVMSEKILSKINFKDSMTLAETFSHEEALALAEYFKLTDKEKRRMKVSANPGAVLVYVLMSKGIVSPNDLSALVTAIYSQTNCIDAKNTIEEIQKNYGDNQRNQRDQHSTKYAQDVLKFASEINKKTALGLGSQCSFSNDEQERITRSHNPGVSFTLIAMSKGEDDIRMPPNYVRKWNKLIGVSSEKSREVVVDDRVNERISEYIPREWKFVARNLGVKECVIEARHVDYVHKLYSLHETSYRVLRTWKQTSGSSATYDALSKALTGEQRTDLASQTLQIGRRDFLTESGVFPILHFTEGLAMREAINLLKKYDITKQPDDRFEKNPGAVCIDLMLKKRIVTLQDFCVRKSGYSYIIEGSLPSLSTEDEMSFEEIVSAKCKDPLVDAMRRLMKSAADMGKDEALTFSLLHKFGGNEDRRISESNNPGVMVAIIALEQEIILPDEIGEYEGFRKFLERQ